MCGINGFLNLSGQSLADPTVLIEKMNDQLVHRGPDDSGVWTAAEQGVFLGHRRLSIIDVSKKGHQPMESAQGNAIVFNGEVYNFAELKRSYAPESFNSHSDTELVLRHYENRGINALNDFNGMFALAVWDSRNDRLFLARDRIGIKPLYYTLQGGFFAFSSEIRSLLTLPWVEKRLDEEATYHYLTYGKVLPPATMFRDIHKLPPGHAMEVDQSGIRSCESFWDVSYRDLGLQDESDAAAQTIEHLRASVRQRMVSDVPVGAFLSGGVDSSAVVALMREHSPSADIKTFSIGFEGQPNYDESEHARKVSQRFETNHFERIVGPSELQDFIRQIVDVFDEPLADPTSIPIYFLSQIAQSEGAKVVLTGDGADELFCGYRSWLKYTKYYPWYNRFLKLPRGLRSAASLGWSAIAPPGVLQEMLHRAANDQEFFWGGANGFKESTKRELLSEEFQRRNPHLDSYSQIMDHKEAWERSSNRNSVDDPVDWMCYLGIKSIVPNYYLHRADRMGMANSVEIRVPFLEHNLVNFGLSLPSDMKLKNGEPKYILKKALEGLLSDDVLYRKKMGFCVPIKEWGGEIMLTYLDQNLSEFCKQTDLFNETYLRGRISAYRRGRLDNVHSLWNLYFLMSWIRRWHS